MKNFLLIFFVFLAACKSRWSYESPQKWGEIDEKFKFCKIGYNQSPIDVKDEFVDNELKFSYQNSDVTKEKKDYVLKVNFDSDDFVLRGKKKYWLRSIVFHHPSEHFVKGDQHSLEMQIYHKSEDEQSLVLAIFFELGEKNSAFDDLLKFVSSDQKEAKINLAKIVKTSDKIFFYDGSLTTPPCAEGVKWYVMKTPVKISKEQMNALIKSTIFAKSNARPLQEFHPEKY